MQIVTSEHSLHYGLPPIVLITFVTRFSLLIMAKRSTPKKQASNSQSTSRYKAFKNKAQKRLLNTTKLNKCPDCKEAKLQHAACPNCGKYNGRQVLNMQKDMDKITKVKA